MAFPISPVNGQTAIVNSISYKYSSATQTWTRVASISNTLTNTLLIDTVIVTGVANSTSTTTGALIVTNGGMGVAGNVYAGGTVYSQGWAVSTGTTTPTAIAGGTTGSILVQTGPNVTGFVNIGTTGTILTSNGTSPYWTTPVTSVGTATTSISEFTATEGQTTFSVAGGYTLNQVQVFANGISLGLGDFTASDGNTIVVTAKRRAGDVIKVVVGQTFNFSPQLAYLVNEVVASTVGQTLWTVSYNPASVQVFLGGSLISPNAYTATNGTTITINSSTALIVTTGTRMDVYSFNSVSISNAISVSGGTINGNLNVVGSLQNNGTDVKSMAIAMATAMSV